jgi:hypothetical protein
MLSEPYRVAYQTSSLKLTNLNKNSNSKNIERCRKYKMINPKKNLIEINRFSISLRMFFYIDHFSIKRIVFEINAIKVLQFYSLIVFELMHVNQSTFSFYHSIYTNFLQLFFLYYFGLQRTVYEINFQKIFFKI